MRISTVTSWFLAAAFLVLGSSAATAQLSVGVQAGLDRDTDATLAGLVLRMPMGPVIVGANIDYGSGSYSYSGFGKQGLDFETDFKVLRLNFPVALPIAVSDGDITVMPFIAPGLYQWNPEFDDWETESDLSIDIGATVMYSVAFATVFVNGDGGPDWGLRVGAALQLGSSK